MTVPPDESPLESSPDAVEERRPAPLLSTRALVLLVCAAAAGTLAVQSAAWAIGLGAGVAVLMILERVTGG
jgi:hypothetical protein